MTQRRTLALAVCHVVTFALSSGTLLAESHPQVRLTLDPCVEDADEVRRIVGIELGALITDAEGSDTTSVRVACKEKGLDISVVDPITGKSLTRPVDLSTAQPNARSRTLALAIAELVTASWTELETNPTPALAPATPPPSPEARAAVLDALRARSLAGGLPHPSVSFSPPVAERAEEPPAAPAPAQPAPPPDRQWQIVALGEGRSFVAESGLAALGLGARLTHEKLDALSWSVDLMLDHGSASTSLGDVTLSSATAAGTLLYRRRLAPLMLDAGIGLRAGVVSLQGEPSNPSKASGSSVFAPWGGPFARLGANASPLRAFIVEASVDAGYVVLPVDGLVDGVRQVSVRGIWGGAQIGAGTFF